MTQFPANTPQLSTPPTMGGFVPPARVKISVMAILSLVMGILGPCTGITAILGIVFGVIALKQIGQSEGQLGGRGLAIAGTCVSAVALLFACLSFSLLIPALGKARTQAKMIKQQTQMRSLYGMTTDHAKKNQDQFPPVDHWEEVFSQGQGDISFLVSTPFDPGVRRAVAMNGKLRGKRFSDVNLPSNTVLMFEAQAGSPQAGGEELLPAQPRAKKGYMMLFVDGHVDFVPPDQMRSVVWEP